MIFTSWTKNNSQNFQIELQDLDYIMNRLLLDITTLDENFTDIVKVDYHKTSKLSDLAKTFLLTFDFDETNPRNYFPTMQSSGEDRIIRVAYRIYLTTKEGILNKRILQDGTTGLLKDLTANLSTNLEIPLENNHRYSSNLMQTEILEIPLITDEYEEETKTNYITATFLLLFKFKRIK